MLRPIVYLIQYRLRKDVACLTGTKKKAALIVGKPVSKTPDISVENSKWYMGSVRRNTDETRFCHQWI